MWRLLVVTVLCLSLVWADGEEKVEREEAQPEFTPPPRPAGDVYFTENFQDPEAVWSRWVKSSAKKDDADEGVEMYDGQWTLEELTTEGARAGDVGLVMKESAKHYAVSAKLDRPFIFDDPDKDAFVIQYEVNFQEGMNCGGAYIKLLVDTEDLDLERFQEKTPYSIMFGPDKCGLSSKVHVIIRFKNPVTGEVEEKHSKQSTESMDFFTDKKTHLFTLTIRADGVYHIIVDQLSFMYGNLLEDLTPPINPPKEIDDPEDEMPEDWDEREKIPDPDAVKPDDWDDDAPPKIPDPNAVKPEGWLDEGPEYIPDPDLEQPEDWDEDEDGEWEPPMISNPACEEFGCGKWEPPMIANPNYRGKWKPELIDNPNYMGKWEPRRIPNPSFFEDKTPFRHLLPISAVGFELWTMSPSVFFDNLIVTSELAIANNYAKDGWTLKFESERQIGGAMSMGPLLDWFVATANEYPLLWAVYALAIVSPFALLAACCVKSKPDEAAKRKKTDEPTPDVHPTPPEGAPEEQGGEEVEGSKDKPEESFVAAADDEEEEGTGEAPPTASSEGEAGEGSQGEGSQEEGSQGEGEGEGSQGDGEGGEGSQEEGGGSQEEGEGAVEEKTTARRSGRKRKGKPRRED